MIGSEVTYCRICVVFTTDMNLHVRRLAHYVEAATNRLGFKSPHLSTKQTEMPRTRFATNMVSTPYCRNHPLDVAKNYVETCFSSNAAAQNQEERVQMNITHNRNSL